MAYTQAQLDALEKALASGALRITTEGQTVEFRSIAELERAIGNVKSELSSAVGKPRHRISRMYTRKGF